MIKTEEQKADRKEYYRKYHLENRETRLTYMKNNYRKRCLDPEYKEKRRTYKKNRYLINIEYRKNKLEDRRRLYHESCEYRESQKSYKRLQYATNPKYRERKRKSYTKRHRELGFIPINDWFINSHAHHINKDQVIYIPEALHLSQYGHRLDRPESMFVINRIAFQYLIDTMKQLGE